VITDNGFGTRNNSRDYLLRIYEITPELGTQTRSPGKVEVNGFIQLSDPAKHLPFTIVNQQSKDRFLTGADLDIESFVFDAQGQMWIGDEFGPYLLEFNTEGQLQNVPILLPAYATDLPFVQSTMNPMLSDDAEAQKNSNLGESRGIEGMAVSPDGYTLYPMLEGPVTGDADDALRIYEFDVRTKSFRPDKFYRYQLDNPEHAIGDMTVINDSEFLVIERDRKEGAEATFKKIFKIDLAKTTNGYVEKTLVADLLNIDDPDNLGGLGETFTFPFITVENVLVLSADTILVINDNNYDGSGGRGPDVIDDNEIIMLQLSKPLALAEGVGRPLSCRD
jgi:glycerophosphoryl diester phosphodiesterase